MTRPWRGPRLRLPWNHSEVDPSSGLAAPEIGEPAAPSVEIARTTRLSETFRALRHRNYRLFYTGQAISLTGTWMQTVAQSWLVIELTDSKAALGIVTTLQFLPITIFVLPAGVIADRVNKRDLILATRALAMVQAILLAVLVATGEAQLWHVYILALVLGVSNAFEQPTRQAMVIEMVGKDDLINAVALNSGLFNGARLVGPSVAGVVIAIAGTEAAFAINAVTFIPSILALTMMDLSELKVTAGKPEAPVNPLGELREGLSFVLRTPAVLMIMILVAFLGTFGYNFITVLPLVARYVLHGDSVDLGFLTAALGLGAFLSALVIASQRRASRPSLFVGGALFALFLGAVALSESFYLSMLFLLLTGMANIVFAATSNTSLQLATPDHLRGRVMALYMLLIAGSTPIGASLTGFMAELLGVQVTIGLLAVACLLGVAIGFLYYVTHREQVEATAQASAVVATAP
jgi:MFS family permease